MQVWICECAASHKLAGYCVCLRCYVFYELWLVGWEVCQVANPDKTCLPLSLMRHDATFHVGVFSNSGICYRYQIFYCLKVNYVRFIENYSSLRTHSGQQELPNMPNMLIYTPFQSFLSFFQFFLYFFLLFCCFLYFFKFWIHAATKHKHRPLEVCPFWATWLCIGGPAPFVDIQGSF